MTTITIKRDTPSKDIPKGFFLGATIETDDVTDLVIIENSLRDLLAKYQEYRYSFDTSDDAGWEDKIARIEAMLAQLKEW